MDFSPFDVRRYRTLPVREGYRQWVQTYERTVEDTMDLRLLNRIRSISWSEIPLAIELACGTGRIGAWLSNVGVRAIDGIDLTPDMLSVARQRGIYRHLIVGDMLNTPFTDHDYQLSIEVLADEHIPSLRPLYEESARLTSPGGHFVVVGYHPYFLMQGVPTHFDLADGESVAIESYVHLFSDHVNAAHHAGWQLVEMDEGLVDDEWIDRKPKWEKFRNRPVSFSFVWRRET